MPMIARGLKKMFKSKRFEPKKFYQNGSSLMRYEKNSKGNKASKIKMNLNLVLVLVVVCQEMC